MDSSLLDVRAVSKRYGATKALDGVSFTLQPGEVCGLLGENGAGKSTLVKLLSGVVAPDSGEILVNGAKFAPRTIVDANERGVSTAFQELSLVPSLSVAVNMFLPQLRRNRLGLVPTRELETMTGEILEEYGVTDIAPSALIADLPLGMRQRVEIVRALRRHPSVLLLDEPTAALTDREWLFRLVERVQASGSSILYISHKLDEVRRLCRRCVILRNGQKVLDSQVSAMSDDAIFSSMAGRSVVEAFTAAPSAIRADKTAAFEVKGLTGHGIADVSLSLAQGEILGVAGLEGHGQSNLFKALVGLAPLQKGTILVNGVEAAIRSPRVAQGLGVVLVPEERKSEGIFNDLSTMANISLPVIDSASRAGFVHTGAERKLVEAVIPSVNLARRYLPLSISALSGGNQQKAILARSLISGAKCLLLFDPTRGVDVGAKQNIYAMMRAFVRDGGAILFYSTELDELVHLCDRCIVLYRNAIAGELSKDDLTQDRMLAIASGRPVIAMSSPSDLAGAGIR